MEDLQEEVPAEAAEAHGRKDMKNMKYIIIGIIAIIVLFVLVTFNGIIKLKNKVKEAFATMDVYLKKRWDIIPNLVETVKGYAKHESETLESVIKMRNTSYDSMSVAEKLNTNEELNRSLSKIIALTENYPEIKADKNFIKLNEELVNIEDDIANSRKYYNAVVRMFNNKVEIFPNNIIAKLFGFKSQKMFEASAFERENVKVEL